MTLKDIKNHFKVIGGDGIYHLYDPNYESSVYMNNRYLCTIHYDAKTNFVKVVNPKHKEMPDMEFYCYFDKKINVLHMVKTAYDLANDLPYPSEFYFPDYNEKYRTFLFLNYYLESIGFVHTGHGWNGDSDFYKLKGIHPYSKGDYITIELHIDDDASNGTIMEHITSFSYTKAEFNGVEDAISKINSIVGVDLLHSASFALSTEAKLSESRDKLSDATFNVIDIDSLTSYTGDMREKAIKALEAALNLLKNNN